MTWPEGFLWGTAASSTQTEGAAPRSDWARWEREGRVPPSGDGNGFVGRHAEDFALYAEHGLHHHRLSLEWARLEPEPGRRDPAEVERYRAMLQSARDAGVAVWVTLHHFSLPGWFADDQRGFLDDSAGLRTWLGHVDWVAETFGDLVHGWQPVNEPVVYAAGGYLMGWLPPGRTNGRDFGAVLGTIHRAGSEAARLLRGDGQPVATIQALSPHFPADDSQEARRATRDVDDAVWRSWADPAQLQHYDLIGFSYYSAHAVDGTGGFHPYPPDQVPGPLGYVPWVQGLADVVRRLAEEHPDTPLLVAELGIGTHDEDHRATYLRDSLTVIEEAIADGIDVRGIFFWTGVDNYEWHHGFDVPFGLFDNDRTPKPAAEAIKSIVTSE
jgi:beta-glucosidase